MNEILYIPTPYPNITLGESFPNGFTPKNAFEALFGIPKIPAQTVDHQIYLTWILPINFIQVDPKLTLIWTYCGEHKINVDWEIEYYYMNQQSYLGYFNEDGSIVMNFDDGCSKRYQAVLKTIGEINRDIIQGTIPYKLIKNGRRSGTLICMQIKTKWVDEVYFMGARIEYTSADIPRDPIGRKRTYKIRYDEDD